MTRPRRPADIVSVLAIVMVPLFLGLSSPNAYAQGDTIINFTTPSKNIDCMMSKSDGAFASCLVKVAAWKKLPPKPADCDLDWAATDVGITSVKSGSTYKNSYWSGGCRGDIGPMCPADCGTLAYGKSRTLGTITCTSAEKGMTCVTIAGPRRGFTVSRAGVIVVR